VSIDPTSCDTEKQDLRNASGALLGPDRGLRVRCAHL